LHKCRFCYVPDTSAIKQGKRLLKLGVEDPDAEWGQYLQLRPWDKSKFLASLWEAENRPHAALKRDGNRAVLFCSTTDPYQVIHHEDPARQRELNELRRLLVRQALILIRDYSTINVRILTRSPLAREDFELYRTFGHRLLFGMSLPTLRNDLARIYEPNAPAPSQRIATLCAAKAAGLNVYVAIAPTYPETDDTDLRATLQAVAELNPVTVFHEPINIHAKNVERIQTHAASLGVTVNTEVFSTPERWRAYALDALHSAERIAGEVGLADRLHLWPDPGLGTADALSDMTGPAALEHSRWIYRWWDRISEWPSA
jgi:DNA repair photolyase